MNNNKSISIALIKKNVKTESINNTQLELGSRIKIRRLYPSKKYRNLNL